MSNKYANFSSINSSFDDEKLIINGNIEITIVETARNTVRIGFEAPNDVRIYREEIYKEILKENARSEVSEVELFKKIDVEPIGKAFDIISKFKK